MAKYAYAERVVKKIRKVLRYDQRLTAVVNTKPQIHVGEDYELSQIRWDYCGFVVLANPTGILCQFGGGSMSTVMYYESYDKLLSIR